MRLSIPCSTIAGIALLCFASPTFAQSAITVTNVDVAFVSPTGVVHAPVPYTKVTFITTHGYTLAGASYQQGIALVNFRHRDWPQGILSTYSTSESVTLDANGMYTRPAPFSLTGYEYFGGYTYSPDGIVEDMTGYTGVQANGPVNEVTKHNAWTLKN